MRRKLVPLARRHAVQAKVAVVVDRTVHWAALILMHVGSDKGRHGRPHRSNIYYTAVLLVQIRHLAQSIVLSCSNETKNNLLNIVRFVVIIHFLPFMFCSISRCLNRCYQYYRSKSILLSPILRGGFISICLQDSILLELLDSRHVYKSLLFEHLYALGVLELFGYHIRLLKDAWQMNV